MKTADLDTTKEMEPINGTRNGTEPINYWPMQRIAAGVFVALWGMVMIVPCLLFIRYTYQQLVELFHTYRLLEQNVFNKSNLRELEHAEPKPPEPQDAGDLYDLKRELLKHDSRTRYFFGSSIQWLDEEFTIK